YQCRAAVTVGKGRTEYVPSPVRNPASLRASGLDGLSIPMFAARIAGAGPLAIAGSGRPVTRIAGGREVARKWRRAGTTVRPITAGAPPAQAHPTRSPRAGTG